MDLPPALFLLTFAGIQLAAMSPGPAFAVVTQRSLRSGRAAGLGAAGGCTLGLFIWLCATMIGLAFLVSKFLWLYGALRMGGGFSSSFPIQRPLPTVTLLPPEQPLWMKITIPLLSGAIEGSWWLFVALTFSANLFRRGYARLKSYLDRTMGAVLGLLGLKLLLVQP